MLIACGQPSSLAPQPSNIPSATTPSAAAAGSGASSSSTSRHACGALDAVKQWLYDKERWELDDVDVTKTQPAEVKHKAAAEVVAAILSSCVETHWSQATIDCLVAAPGAERAGSGARHCTSPEATRLLNDAFDAAEEAVFTQFFGPVPGSDALEQFAAEQERLAAEKERLAAEPR